MIFLGRFVHPPVCLVFFPEQKRVKGQSLNSRSSCGKRPLFTEEKRRVVNSDDEAGALVSRFVPDSLPLSGLRLPFNPASPCWSRSGNAALPFPLLSFTQPAPTGRHINERNVRRRRGARAAQACQTRALTLLCLLLEFSV